MTEQRAIEGCKREDRISQKYLFDTYSDGMLMVCLRYVKSLPDAEEILLTGFFNFYRAIDRFIYTGQGSIGPWLKKIMVNECLMYLRKQGGLKIKEEAYGAEIAAPDGHIARMSANEIYRLVQQLPDGYRTVFNLFAIEGYGHKEIAAMLGISEGTSKSQLNKARMQLQKVIKERAL
jgi:RNA polymerase sigma factor (sigma-70 family)